MLTALLALTASLGTLAAGHRRFVWENCPMQVKRVPAGRSISD
jgi:hypothetical protein